MASSAQPGSQSLSLYQIRSCSCSKALWSFQPTINVATPIVYKIPLWTSVKYQCLHNSSFVFRPKELIVFHNLQPTCILTDHCFCTSLTNLLAISAWSCCMIFMRDENFSTKAWLEYRTSCRLSIYTLHLQTWASGVGVFAWASWHDTKSAVS